MINSLKTYSFVSLFFVCAFLCIPTNSIQAQSNKKVQLQKQYNKIQQEIKEIESLLKSTQAEKSTSLSQLKNIQSKIAKRKNLIANINEQINLLNAQIAEKQKAINKLEEEINRLKEDYAAMIKNAYHSKFKSSPISFIFNANSFNQAIQRLTYLQSYARTRANQSELIKSNIADLNDKILALQNDKKEKERFLSEALNQKKLLEVEEAEVNKLLAELKKEEKELQQQAKEKNKAAKALNNQIQKIIAEEIRLAKEKAAKEAKKSGTTVTKGLALTPEEKIISNNFVSNRGSLPWPVSKGFIISQFGKHKHPSLPEVYTNNNGIDIKTETNASVRTIFGGTVVNSFYLPSSQNSVIIKHGEYYSVYSNLKTVEVKAGDKIETKQTIGKVYTENGVSKVHLEIWKGIEKTNPELWLAK